MFSNVSETLLTLLTLSTSGIAGGEGGAVVWQPHAAEFKGKQNKYFK